VGLIQREIEKLGITTISLGVSVMRQVIESIKPPRVCIVKFPLGATVGEPNNKQIQMKVINETLEAVQTNQQAGSIRELPYQWRN